MKFVDEVRIQVKTGNGGHGCVSFRREKYIPKGGLTAGTAGTVAMFTCKGHSLNTLVDYRFERFHAAQRGQNGMGSNCTGKSGQDKTLIVPLVHACLISKQAKFRRPGSIRANAPRRPRGSSWNRQHPL